MEEEETSFTIVVRFLELRISHPNLGINALRRVFTSMWILFHFIEHQWHFTSLFPQSFFSLDVLLRPGKIKTELNLVSEEQSQGKKVGLKSWLHITDWSSNNS